MLKHNAKVVISALLMTFSVTSFAGGDELFSESDYQTRSTKFAFIADLPAIENAIIKAPFGYFPMQDPQFKDFIETLRVAPESQSYEVFKIIKMTIEYYKLNLAQTLNAEGKGKYLLEMTQILTASSRYFEKARHEVGIQYLQNLDLFIAEATMAIDTKSHKGRTATPDTSEEQARKAEEVRIQRAILAEQEYKNFEAKLIYESSDNKNQATKILIARADDLLKKYKNAAENIKGTIVYDLIPLSYHALRYMETSKNEFGVQYFKKFQNQVIQIKLEGDEMIKKASAEANKGALELLLHNFPTDIQTFAKDAKEQNLKTGIKQFNYLGTTIEVQLREVYELSRKGNVTQLAPFNAREKVYTLRVVTPSKDSNKAMAIASKALLTSPHVDGIYFDDKIRVPSNIKINFFEVSNLGSNILIRSQLSCQGFFNLSLK